MSDFNPFQAQLDQIEARITENRALIDDPELAELAKSEISQLEAEKAVLLDALSQMGGSSGAEDTTSQVFTNCIIEVRQGAGGDEAKIWANDLLRMYLRFIERTTLKVEFLDELVVKIKGKTSWEFSEAELALAEANQTSLTGGTAPLALAASAVTRNGAGEPVISAYELFKYELGVHRVQRVPATEAAGRIHTSTASVAVLPEVKKNAVEVKDGDLEWQFMRAGGAGGQNVNKVKSSRLATARR